MTRPVAPQIITYLRPSWGSMMVAARSAHGGID